MFVVVLLVVTGVKQSQLLDLSLGLGLEFDKIFCQIATKGLNTTRVVQKFFSHERGHS